MRIAAELIDEILAHAREDAPTECCGVVAVRPGATARTPGEAVSVHRAINAAASPLRFEIDPRTVLALISRIEEEDLELGAIYHSHTRTAAFPSQTDINFAASWPGVEWIIVGLAARNSTPEVRSFLIDAGEVREIALGASEP
ncbi:MAG: M67 family metallopeptidase [Acidobacteriota bacterium]|nr:M67 family metallopeptidase [Acidobacteriota bacterium]